MNDKLGAPKSSKFLSFGLVGLSLLFLILGSVCGKLGAKEIDIDGFNPIQLVKPIIVLGYVFLISQGVVWILAIRRIDLSFAYPFMSLAYLPILVISHYQFAEVITTGKVAGCLLISFGVASIAYGEWRKSRD